MKRLFVALSLLLVGLSPSFANRGDFKYASHNFTTAGHLQLTGQGTGWFVYAQGGAVTFNINGGDTVTLPSGAWISGDFNLSPSPTVNVLSVASGTVEVVMTGVATN